MLHTVLTTVSIKKTWYFRKKIICFHSIFLNAMNKSSNAFGFPHSMEDKSSNYFQRHSFQTGQNATKKLRNAPLLTLTDSERRSLVIKHWVLCEFVPRRADSRCFPALCLNLKWKCDIFFPLSLCFCQWSSPWRLNARVYGRWGPKSFTLKGSLWGVASI